MTESFKIIKIRGNSSEIVEDNLVEEVPLTIIAHDKELATFLCTPTDIEDLVRGFLLTSGLITRLSDIKQINLDQKRWTAYVELNKETIVEGMIFKRVYTSGCGKGTLFYNAFDLIERCRIKSSLKVTNTWIYALMMDFQKRSKLFLETGGAHSAAVADRKGILVFKEDIGRHNAIDKIVGYCLLKKLSLKNKILITSGRISSEVLLKSQKCKFPIIVSKGAPTNHAVKLANDMNITLVGFVRGKSMNVYSSKERIETV